MTLPLRLLLLFAAAAVAAIVLWPNSVSLPFQPGKPYTGPGFEVAADTPCPISGWIALAPENVSSTAAAAAPPSLAIAPTPTMTTTTAPAPAPPVYSIYSIACVQPVYLANADVVAIPVAAQWLGMVFIGSNSYDTYNYYLIPAPPNASFVIYRSQSYLVSKQYFAPFNYTLYIVEPVAAVPDVAGWRYIGDVNLYVYGAADIYHLYLADVTWRFYNADYVNATITADPAMYYFLPRK
jgi:hypothetical protein